MYLSLPSVRVRQKNARLGSLAASITSVSVFDSTETRLGLYWRFVLQHPGNPTRYLPTCIQLKNFFSSFAQGTSDSCAICKVKERWLERIFSLFGKFGGASEGSLSIWCLVNSAGLVHSSGRSRGQ